MDAPQAARSLLVMLVPCAVAAAQSPFGPSPLSTLDMPQRLAIGDLNADGHADVVVAHANGVVQVTWNAGSAEFVSPLTLPGSSFAAPSAIELADIDADGDLDILTLNDSNVRVHRNLGGTFGAASVTPSGIYGAGMVVADFDGDGWRDVVVGSSGSLYAARYLRNNGSGGLLAGTTVAGSGALIRHLGGADIDGDGDVDLVLLQQSSVVVMTCNGNGTFAPFVPVASLTGMLVTSSDWNEDGLVDLAVADYVGNVHFLANTGGLTFAASLLVGSASPTPQQLSAVDADGDGHADLAWSNYGGTNTVVRGAGDGTFAAFSRNPIAAKAFAIGELDGDGRPDAAYLRESLQDVVVALGDDQGSFGPRRYPLGGQVPTCAFADVNLDGRLDVVAADLNGNRLVVRLALAGGGFGAEIATSCPAPSKIAVARVNADATPDVVVACDDDFLRTFLGDGTGAFGSPVGSQSSRGITGFAADDVTGDGLSDVAYGYAFVNGSGYLQQGTVVSSGNGAGGYAPISFSSWSSSAVAIGDWNSDGIGDVARIEASQLHLLLSNGSGGFTLSSRAAPAYAQLAAADLNGDGYQDLLGADRYTGVHVYWGDGVGGLAPDVLLPGDDAQRVHAADLDQDGDLDVFGGDDEHVYVLDQTALGVFVELGRVASMSYAPSGIAVVDATGDGRRDLLVVSRITSELSLHENVGVPGDSEIYCDSQTSSNGCVPSIATSGAPSATATSGFTISTSNTQNNRRGMLVYSLSGRAATPFQGGTLCVRAPVFRSPIVMSGGSPSGLDCSGSLVRDWNAFVHGIGGGSPQPAASIVGTQVTAQWWSRDLGSFPGQTNLSNAVDFAVGP